ncbi:MBOAT family O-acyltransferase [Paenibacillus sp. y28]|uniref:MBOAT family O-acyltransferase n=1 Tax=Paenibacillus sp. y28 TaxID=3129110 RepID=UPI0030193A1C
MWYLNMTAMGALAGMIALLMLTRRWSGNKRLLVLLFNLGFLLVFSQKLFVFYLIYTLGNYTVYRHLCLTESGRRAKFIAAVFANIAAVVILRLFGMGTLEHALFDVVITLGLIYNLLKVIDAYYFAYYVGKDGKAPLIDYFNFVLFIPTFTSGPILKFRDFLADTRQPYNVDSKVFEWAVKRIILGLFKKIVVVAIMMSVFQRVLDLPELHTHHSLFLMIWFYALIYFDFSGYSDIAIGFGRLMGYNIPENFKKPFLSPTLTQYWRNWHATMADWFRDHIFLIFARRSTSRWTAAWLSMLVMILIGLWHGFSWLYVLWGLYHGIVLAIENVTNRSTVNKKKVSRRYFYWRCFVTQAIVTIAVIVYSGSSETVLQIYRGLLNWPSF